MLSKDLHDASTQIVDDDMTSAQVIQALNVGRIGSWTWDIATSNVRGDPFVAELLGLDYNDQPWQLHEVFGSIHPEDLPRVQQSVDDALVGTADYDAEFRDRTINPETGQQGIRWLGARGRVTERDTDGTPLAMVGVIWDITKQKMREARLTMLASEMDHRVKNAFAVILALIKLGKRSLQSVDNLTANLSTQVEAIATAHSVSARLVRNTGEEGVFTSLRELIDLSFSGWRDAGGALNAQLQIDCTENIKISARKVSPFAMLLYELSTNAAKSGALGTAQGAITVTARENDDQSLTLIWDETIPSGIAPPNPDEGFGPILLNHCAQSLGGKITRKLRTSGLTVTLKIPPM